MKVFRTQLVLVFFSLVVFIIYFQGLDNPEKNAMSLAVFLFLPFFICGVLINYIIIKFLERINVKYRFLNYLVSLLLVPLFFFIRKWEFTDAFYLVISVVFLSNMIGYFFIKDEKKLNILSTKKLTETQKQELTNTGFSVTDKDFIEVKSKDFEWINRYDFLIFTSQNAVKSVLLHKDIAQIKAKKCFCVGEKTKQLLEQNDFEVIHFSEYAAELATVICDQYNKNSYTFFCGNLRRETLPEAMKNTRIPFSEICVYETKLTPKKITKPIDGILFFSLSGVESYLKENKIDDKICFCIGYTTAETLKEKTENIVIASKPTVEDVINLTCLTFKVQSFRLPKTTLNFKP